MESLLDSVLLTVQSVCNLFESASLTVQSAYKLAVIHIFIGFGAFSHGVTAVGLGYAFVRYRWSKVSDLLNI